jgi:hypothetical protein
MGRIIDGVDVEFTQEEKELILMLNYENPPRGCVGYWCEWCFFSSMSKQYFQVDHIIPVAKAVEFGVTAGFIASVDNACVLCAPCNQSKGKHDYPRHGVGLAYRIPNQNMTWGEKRAQFLSFDEMVQMAKRKGKYRYRG